MEMLKYFLMSQMKSMTITIERLIKEIVVMKRYIRNSYTMDHQNKLKVMEWLDDSAERISRFCKQHSNDTTYYEVDDVSWGTDCINIPVFQGSFDDPRKRKQIDSFRFCYDPDDVFERSAEDQLAEELDEFLDLLKLRIK